MKGISIWLHWRLLPSWCSCLQLFQQVLAPGIISITAIALVDAADEMTFHVAANRRQIAVSARPAK